MEVGDGSRRTRVEEHESDGGGLLVDLEGVSGEDDALGDDALGVGVEERSLRNEDRGWTAQADRTSQCVPEAMFGRIY